MKLKTLLEEYGDYEIISTENGGRNITITVSEPIKVEFTDEDREFFKYCERLYKTQIDYVTVDGACEDCEIKLWAGKPVFLNDMKKWMPPNDNVKFYNVNPNFHVLDKIPTGAIVKRCDILNLKLSKEVILRLKDLKRIYKNFDFYISTDDRLYIIYMEQWNYEIFSQRWELPLDSLEYNTVYNIDDINLESK